MDRGRHGRDLHDATGRLGVVSHQTGRTAGAIGRAFRKILGESGDWFWHCRGMDEPEPPPFPLTRETAALLGPYFRLAVDQSVTDSVEVYRGMEHWQEWQRLAD